MYIYIYIYILYIVINSYVISRVNPYESTGCIAVFRFAKVHANPARTTGVADTVLTGEKIPVFFCEKKSVAGDFFELNSVVFVKKKRRCDW